jgi:hypothetical protein
VTGVQTCALPISTDGNTIAYYNPRVGSGEVQPYKPTSAGSFPKGVLGLETWRARLIAFGLRDDPYAIFATAVGDPFNCDTNPPQENIVTRAFYRPVGGAGQIEDIVTGFIPYSDAMRLGAEVSAIVLGDHTMWRLTGDPVDGGRIENLSRAYGGALGRAWCLGPKGEVYVWTNAGSIVVLAPGSAPSVFSPDGMAREFESVDLSQFYIRMAWDTRRRGLMIAACPYGNVTAETQLFFFEASGPGFWKESTAHVVTDLIVLDADKPNDRQVVMLCSDGYGRTWDFDGNDDDGERIQAYTTIGPIHSGDAGVQAIIMRLQALIDHTGEPVVVEVWGSQYATSIGSMLRRFSIQPGMSPLLSVRARANFLWIVIRGSTAWTFNRLHAEIGGGGALRMKS